jgi:hypothetical protein
MHSEAKAKVCLTFGRYQGDRFVSRECVLGDVVKIGRDPKSQLVVDDELASRMHAIVEASSHHEISLVDLGSHVGTVVNGSRIARCKLRPGDEIRIGATVLVLEQVGAVAQDWIETGADESAYALVKSGPDVDPDDVELGHVAAVEVVILWGDTVLHVEHASPPRSFYVGETGGKRLACDYFIPSEKLGTPRAPIVLADDGAIHLIVLPGARGSIEIPGQPPIALEDAVRSGGTLALTEPFGARRVALPPGAKARMELQGLVFQVASVAAGKPIARGLFANTDSNSLLYVGLSFLTHAALVAAMASFVPPLGLADDEARRREDQYLIQQYLRAAAEREEAAKENDAVAESDADEREGGSGERAKDEEGSMGQPNSKQAAHRYGVQGQRDNPDPHLAREAARREAAAFGMIGLLASGTGGDPNAPTASWGRDESLGRDESSARGNMWGATIDEAFGAAGLGLTGVGEGGGSSGEGIGLDAIGTLGVSGIGNEAGFGPGGIGRHHGRLAKGHAPRAPQFRVGETTIQGRLPGEIVQRIVRQNYGRFRLCYEGGLRNNPSLQGRVEIRFVIGRDGAVSGVSNGRSDLPDPHVVQCVAQAYYGLSFPQPEGGIVTVVYPIVFSPGD